MASIRDFSCEAGDFTTLILSKQAELESVLKQYHFAALIIQSAYRGYKQRQEILKWHRAATVLQKYIRRWLVIWHLPQIYKEYYEWFCAWHYNRMATRIQALWKGYWYRKDRLSPKELLQKKKELEEMNERNKKALVSASQAELEKMSRLDKEAEQWVLFILFKLHHHLRSYVTEGVFSTHDSKELSSIEKLFKALPLYEYLHDVKQIYYKKLANKKPRAPAYMFKKYAMRNLEDAYRNRDRTFDKELPVSEPSFINDKPFVRHAKMKRAPYEKLICNDGKFSDKDYVFREEDPSRNVCKKDFDLLLLKKSTIKERPPPYYLDFWAKICDVHNIPDD